MAEYIEREADSFKYYVVRNKKTGLYFRGKGVNKWGKYYNQASVYRFKKHAENAVEEETGRGNPTEVVEIRIAEATADVVVVVRCSECKHHHDPMRCSLWYGTLDDNEYFLEHGKDFYCAFGERRSENEG